MQKIKKKLLAEASEALAVDDIDSSAEKLAQVCHLFPRDERLWCFLARVELKRCNMQGHDIAMKRAIQIKPNAAHLYFRYAVACPPMMTTLNDIQRIRQQMLDKVEKIHAIQHKFKQPILLSEVPTLSFYSGYHGEDEKHINSQIFSLLRKLSHQELIYSPHVGRKTEGKIKLGIFSTCMRHHTIGRLFGEMLARLDQSIFEPTLIIHKPDADDYTHSLAQQLGNAFYIPKNAKQAALRLETLKLDLLFFPDVGMDSFISFLALNRIATAQCTTWGHPITTGIETMDAFLSVDGLEPERNDPPYSETLLCQSLVNSYYKPPPKPNEKNRQRFGFPNANIYGCPQTVFKFHPSYDQVLIDIYKRDPKACFVLSNSGFIYWANLFTRRLDNKCPGISKRIYWLDKVSRSDFVEALSYFDVMLDPFPFGGGNTTLEALAVDTPVVTLPQKFARGRLATTFYQQMNWTKLVAKNTDEYVDLSIKLANEPSFRKQIVREIQTHRGTLYENSEAVSQFGELLQQAYQIGIQRCKANR